jgi:acid phosphatase family membrane protein YuiD
MHDYVYLFAPFLAWLIAGILKFLINSIKSRRLAFDLIGYGGMPSNHSAIVCSIVALIAYKEGMNNPAFGVAVAFAFIVMLDASSLRRQVGKHAASLNTINKIVHSDLPVLRERMGHTRIEIMSGALLGLIVGYLVGLLSSWAI